MAIDQVLSNFYSLHSQKDIVFVFEQRIKDKTINIKTNPNDYLAGYSIDEHGIEKVKLHSLTDFQPTAKLNQCLLIEAKAIITAQN